ncbi:hypothetical protein HETIRDRAFT_99067 [Heterobasidion irregulare TC 32-1]|uniref:Uncharacterized protein n=1 Tax=Heterobasidion irregulare (strain TC 32-1) TaxID=747525 RepID=W4KMJ1_HETIT|nr:uncharacterized protein HETIRDRAFT_99067 [Heterobasidion irregulare TC 32-1]ETW86595.1 hypothetical protein HETIRDRAFT_99067 [Heterobasidion irregulare TC 32-1]
MADVRIPPQRQRTVDQTPTLIEKEQDKLSLRQKLHTITSLIPVLLAILEEQGVLVPYRVMGKNYKAADAFHRRLGLQKDNFTQGIHALAILLSRSNASVSVRADDSSMSMPPSDSVILLAATAVCLPKSLPAFPGRQYITVTHSHGAEAIGGVVGQTFSPDRALLQILKNPSDHIYRIRTMSGLMQSEPEFLGRVHPSAIRAAWLAHRDRLDSIEGMGFKALHPPIIGASESACFSILARYLRVSRPNFFGDPAATSGDRVVSQAKKTASS